MVHPTAEVVQSTPKSVVLGAIWRARWIILSAILVAGVGGYLLSQSQPAVYTAQSRIVLSSAQNFDPIGSQAYMDPARYVANQVSIMTTQPVLVIAADLLDDGTDPGELARSLQVAPAGANDVITVAASGPTGAAAAERANAVLAAYQQYVDARVREAARAAAAATTDPVVADEIQTKAAVYGDGVDVTERAGPSAAPSTPKPLRDGLVLAALAGLVATGLAVWRRGPADDAALLNAAAHARVLGIVPVRPVRRGRSPGVEPGDHALALVALDYARQDTPGPVLVTEASWDSGAASVAHGLALSAALQGRRVLMIDAEPGSRELVTRSGGLEPEATLDALGRSTTSDEDVLVPLPVPNSGAADLRLATIGPADGAGPMNGEAIRKCLDRLQSEFELIVIQVGPVSESPVAFALVREADLVIAAVGLKEEADRLTTLRDRLETAQRQLTGVVMTRPVRLVRAGRLRAAGIRSRGTGLIPTPAPGFNVPPR